MSADERAALNATLRELAGVLHQSDRGHPSAEAHLRAHGWDWVPGKTFGGRWMSPAEQAAVGYPCPDCTNGEVILNPQWPSGDLPYSEKCTTCGGGHDS